MKKKTIIAILAATAALVVLFAACSKGGKTEGTTNPTVVGADGNVYEEVTEIHSELVTEVVSEVVSEVVTGDDGKAVTNKDGKTEIKSEVVTEIKSEVVTSVVKVTKPYAAPTTTKKGETTAAGTTATPGTSAAEGTTTYEDVTFPKGTVVEVATNAQGAPSQPKLRKAMASVIANKQLYLSCRVVTNDSDFTGFSDIPYKVYVKGNKMAFEVSYAALKMRVVSDGGSVSILFPVAKTYYTASSDEASLPDVDLDAFSSISGENLNYVKTTRVKVNGITYTCEEYNDGQGSTNKYYFNSNDQLKRIEILSSDGTTLIMKVTDFSSSVSDSIFTIPSGYTKLTEDALGSMLGGLM